MLTFQDLLEILQLPIMREAKTTRGIWCILVYQAKRIDQIGSYAMLAKRHLGDLNTATRVRHLAADKGHLVVNGRNVSLTSKVTKVFDAHPILSDPEQVKRLINVVVKAIDGGLTTTLRFLVWVEACIQFKGTTYAELGEARDSLEWYRSMRTKYLGLKLNFESAYRQFVSPTSSACPHLIAGEGKWQNSDTVKPIAFTRDGVALKNSLLTDMEL